jgi:hypothetical protein
VLHTGETKKLDVDGGDYYDMTITLDKLSSKGAEFTLLRIHELMPGARPPIPMPQRQTNATSGAGEPAVPEDDGFAGVPDAVLTRHILTPILMLVLAIFVALDVAVLFVYLILRLRRESYA